MSMSFSSESVSPGHPDAVAGYIADSFVREYLAQDDQSHVGVEVMVTGENVFLGGEVKSKALNTVDPVNVVHRAIADCGYTKDEQGIILSKLSIFNSIHTQSPDIDQGVTKQDGSSVGAGDNGMVAGGATTNKDANWLPLAYWYTTRLQRKLWALHQTEPSRFYPDSKCQVTVDSEQKVSVIVVSASYAKAVSDESARADLYKLIDAWLFEDDVPVSEGCKKYVNFTGSFHVCGPIADCGINGRKLVADSYGGYFPIMGGAQTGKDPTKVDRSGVYMTRYLAKSVARYLKTLHPDSYFDVLIQVGYCIGNAHPVSCYVKITDDVGNVCFWEASEALAEAFTSKGWLDVAKMINFFDLRHYDLRPTASLGMFTDERYPWEAEPNDDLKALISKAWQDE